MSDPNPQPGQSHEGFIKRAEEWLESHVRPELADARIKAEQAAADTAKALQWLKAHTENAQALGNLVVKLIGLIDPADSTAAQALLGEAEAFVTEAERIAQEIAARVEGTADPAEDHTA
jgi:hypothetical protein